MPVGEAGLPATSEKQKPREVALPRLSRGGGAKSAVATTARAWIFVGVCAVCIVFGGAGGWGAVVPLASAVIALGQVTVDSNRKQVQHLEGGIVSEIRVRDGDAVKAEDVLLRLDATRARATYLILLGSLREELAKAARLVAERDRQDTVAWPDELEAARGEPTVQALIKSQTAIFESRRLTLKGETEILAERIEQLKQEIVGLKAQRVSTDGQSDLIQEEIDGLLILFERGQTTRRRLLSLQREAQKLRGDKGKLTAEIARANRAIGETKLEMIQRLKTFHNEVVTTLRDVQAKILDLRERFAAARDVLDRLDIRAPVDGKVVGLTVHAAGGVVKPGETIMEIVPSNDRLTVEVKVQPQDIDNVSLGQESNVRLLAFKQRTTPTLAGMVSYVSADTMNDPKDGSSFYLARIEVPEEELKRLKGEVLQPGMPAEVLIRTGARTALMYLVQPILDSMNRAWREE